MNPNESRVRFDKTINLGHILTFAGFVIVALTQWNVMDKRVVVLEEARQAQRERDQSQDAASKEKFQEVRDALNDIKRSVEKLADKLGAK
jgi:hypothetical protein